MHTNTYMHSHIFVHLKTYIFCTHAYLHMFTHRYTGRFSVILTIKVWQLPQVMLLYEMLTEENIWPHLSHLGAPWGHSVLVHHQSVLLWVPALASPFLNRCWVSCLLGMGAGLWLQTLTLLRLSGLCRSLGHAHQSFCLSKPCNAPSSESGKFILVPKQKHCDPGPTWNRSLKFPIWWTAVVSNLLNQFATLLRSCVSDHESRLTWPVRGLVRLHGELH